MYITYSIWCATIGYLVGVSQQCWSLPPYPTVSFSPTSYLGLKNKGAADGCTSMRWSPEAVEVLCRVSSKYRRQVAREVEKTAKGNRGTEVIFTLWEWQQSGSAGGGGGGRSGALLCICGWRRVYFLPFFGCEFSNSSFLLGRGSRYATSISVFLSSLRDSDLLPSQLRSCRPPLLAWFVAFERWICRRFSSQDWGPRYSIHPPACFGWRSTTVRCTLSTVHHSTGKG